MNLNKITIEGYKSIGKIEIVNPNPFTVFAGANALGKSNIFEAIEFLTLCSIMQPDNVIQLFGNTNEILNQQNVINDAVELKFEVDLAKNIKPFLLIGFKNIYEILHPNIGFSSDIGKPLYDDEKPLAKDVTRDASYQQFFNFTRLFVGHPSRLTRNDDSRLNTNASNLEKVLKRILKDENKREEIHEILQLLIPGFERVEIVTESLSGKDSMIVYETYLKKPLTKEFISDGTYNIIAIMTAIFQSDEPQFLCIEEPENGLNPKVVKELGDIIRDICEEKGHYIWLNTHSQSLVSELTTEEIIIVEKKEGLTKIKQIQGINLHGLRMDDALYTNSIGGGNPW